MENGHFYSQTHGQLDINKLREITIGFIKNDPEKKYRLFIGTDSEAKNSHGTDFVTAFVVHRVGRGGIYFWRRKIEEKSYVLRQRIYQEAALSLDAASEIIEIFKKDGISRLDLEIHVDIGEHGETREMIAEIVGMIRGSGYPVKTKPDSYVASKVADRHT
ncbi:ribonuclease H-like YkuK family protein [Candidatus Gottesmanbacteria bacterium]|nr:ribonuclease H-like YkuK family protein [Candidatus Gottesmanbacteria bacterium]